MSSRTLQIVALLCLSAATLSAQGIIAKAGSRVRVDAKQPGIWKMTGVMEASRGDSMVIRPDNSDSSIAIPMTQVQRLQVSRGMRRNAMAALGRGLLSGVAVGTALGFAITPDEREFIINSRSEQALVYGVSFGIVGGAVGLVTGTLWKSEGWQTVPRSDPRVRIAAVSTRSGMGLGGRITY